MKSSKQSDKKPLTENFPTVENYSLKNILSLFLMITMPHFVMALIYIVRKCNSDFLEFFRQCIDKSIIEIFQEIWFKDELDFKFGLLTSLGYFAFALLLMIIVPGKIIEGHITPKGNVPLYKDNGFSCYILSLLTFGLLSYSLSAWSQHSVSMVYIKFPSILTCLSILGFSFCFILYFKGLYFPTCPDRSVSGYFFFDYYWGVELHPRIKGLDVKVFTNCRFGMTAWALLILCYLKYSIEVGSVHGGLVVSVILQHLYILKFFWWESGYYSTLDMILDHGGFYLCWGCIVFIPGFLTLPSYHMASVPTEMSQIFYIAMLVVGILSLILNYWADYQKQFVRASDGKCMIWRKPVKVIRAEYKDLNGRNRKSILIISGFWGLARHFHYFPELLLAFCLCASSGFNHIMPFGYFIFLLILMIHRLERDDKKCSAKYGKFYENYKSIVRWKIFPYIY